MLKLHHRSLRNGADRRKVAQLQHAKKFAESLWMRVVTAVLMRPRWTMAAWLGVLLVAALGLTQLRVDFGSTAFFGDDREQLEELQTLVDHWGPDDRELAVVVSAPDRSWAEADARAQLRELERLVARADSVVTTRSIASLLESLPQVAHPAAVAAATPLLVSHSREHAAIVVQLDRSTDDLQAAIEAVAAVRAQLADAQQDDWTVELAGIPAIRAAFFELTIRDQLRLGPLALLLGVATMWLLTRKLTVALVAAVGAGVPTIVLAGAMGWAGVPVGLLTQALFTMVPIIAIADTIHVVVGVRARAGAKPATAPAVIAATMREVGTACLLTTLTTAVGFASMAVAELPVLRAFGLWAAAGVLLAYVCVLTLVPALLLRLDAGHGAPSGSAKLRAVASACTRRPRAVLLVTLAVVLASIPAARSVVVDNHLGALLRPSHPVRVAADVLDNSLGGSLALEVVLENAAPPARARAAELLRELPQARAVLGPVRHGSLTRFTVRVPDLGGQAFSKLEHTVDARLNELPCPVVTTGVASVAYRGVNRVTQALRTSLLLVLATVVVMVGVVFRSIDLAWRSVLPNTLPLGLGYACVGAVSLELDPLGVVVLTVALGIAVDDTLHILHGFWRAREAGASRADAAVESVSRCGHAVMITTLVLACGLSINMLSAFPPLGVLGSLGATVLVLAMVADITVLPALLVWPARPTEAPGARTGSAPRATTQR